MCGVAGFQGKEIPDEKNILNSMISVIEHRGPDDRGAICVDRTSLGHARLAIIDIEGGKQPMQSIDGRFSIVFNGEIYNYLELRQQLLGEGFKFKTHSDTEVLLNMYIKYGKKALDYLNGMFAFAVYDSIKKTLFIARDHFGIKPLYYYCGDNSFVFASEIKALLKYPGITAEIDRDSLYEYTTYQMVLSDRTLFRNIFKLEPATYIIVKNGKIKETNKYWEIRYEIDGGKTINEYSEELLLLLESSLNFQMRSDVPVGSYLSGGLDSSIVATLASNNYFGSFKTFTGGFKEAGIYDETRYARTVRDHIKSEHYEIFPSYKDFINSFESLIYHMDEPGGGPGLFPQYMVSKLASEHVKVVLGGQGGDEIFGGYARYAVAYLEQCIKGAIFETQEEGKYVVTLQSIIPNMHVLKEYLPMLKNQFESGLFENMERRYYRLVNRALDMHQIYSADFLNERDEEKLFEKFCLIFNNPDTKSYFNKMTYFDLKTLLPTLLQIEDRMSMAVSLESRVPLLDKRIVELSAVIPPTLKFAGGKIKNMLLQSVKNILPREIIDRKDKMGFPTPVNEWFAGPLKDYVLDIFKSQKTKERNLFNIPELEKKIIKGDKFNRDLWGALNIEVWHRIFID